MIVPHGMTLKLDPRDEYQHEPEAASNFNESMYFDVFDRRRSIGAWFRIGNRVNEGHAEVTVCVHLSDGRVAFWFARPQIASNASLDAGGFKVSVVEPFKALHIAYEGEVLILDDAKALRDARSAFKQSPRAHASISLDLSGVSPMHGGEIVNLDGSRWDLDPETSAYRGHTEQHIAARGTIRVGDTVIDVDGFGFRDKSWGPRHWGNLYWHKWTPVTFGPDFGVLLALMGRPGQEPDVVGHVWRDGALLPLTDARLDVDYGPDFVQRSMTLELETAAGRTLMTGEVLSTTPLQHRKANPAGGETLVRIIKGVTLFKCEGREAWGMSEFLDLVEDGRPVSTLRHL
ncbi:DUF7064 domain-containing protein [Brevundimonas abyssalis]|uniref:DUF7064 domain-containing protein n=1 Tax=Brevundimonas abyssalis TAR-001 TaxID=1391729 RepID=A0A8E0KLJ9_9CAUL|nr:hypothetical protein [Brevundimonas abyssalis]GAD58622.1 hypothetical protein MBEBAB_0872 [Brevundimonas abyssalis TAR-001]